MDLSNTPSPSPTDGSTQLGDKLDLSIARLKERIKDLAKENKSLAELKNIAMPTLTLVQQQLDNHRSLCHRLAQISAESAEMIVDNEEKQEALNDLNIVLARSNAHAAELMAEIELRNEEIKQLNGRLAEVNSHSAELLASLEIKEGELQEMNRELQAEIEEKNRLLGLVAHDLRGGIGGIGNLSLILKENLDSGEGDSFEYIDLIHKQSAQLQRLLESVLDIEKIQQGSLDLQLSNVCLGKLIDETAKFYKQIAGLKNIELKTNLPHGSAMAVVDPEKIRQVLVNLLTNAIKQSPSGSTITLDLIQKGNEVMVRVIDEGPGLSPDDLSKVFKSSTPQSAKPTGNEASQGLGLAISQRIIQRHGGRILAQNNFQAKGACFFFCINTDHLEISKEN
ncbi:MAG: ATP-binding protein [Myxococcota bacterium]|nr:ATP-binding protein [Myxococcota bacterium]